MNPPIIIVRTQENGVTSYTAYSPLNYEMNDREHPMMNPSYHRFAERVMDTFNIEIQYSIYTDFNCTTTINERGNMIFFTTLFDNVFSPVAFNASTVNTYMNNVINNQGPHYRNLYRDRYTFHSVNHVHV